MLAPSDDDRMAILPRQFLDGPMGVMDQRTGRFQHAQPAFPQRQKCFVRRAVRGDHDRRRSHVLHAVFHAQAAGAQARQHGLVVRQFAQNGQRRRTVRARARSMASRTPKHMPRCAARMIFKARGAAAGFLRIHFASQSNPTALREKCSIFLAFIFFALGTGGKRSAPSPSVGRERRRAVTFSGEIEPRLERSLALPLRAIRNLQSAICNRVTARRSLALPWGRNRCGLFSFSAAPAPRFPPADQCRRERPSAPPASARRCVSGRDP